MTTYRGTAFGSEICARWAVFLDMLGVRWELSENSRSLCRFHLPEHPASLMASDDYTEGNLLDVMQYVLDTRDTVLLLPSRIPDSCDGVIWYKTLYWSWMTESIAWKWSPILWKRGRIIIALTANPDPDLRDEEQHFFYSANGMEPLTPDMGAALLPVDTLTDSRLDAGEENVLEEAFEAARNAAFSNDAPMSELDVCYSLIEDMTEALNFRKKKQLLEAEDIERLTCLFVGEVGTPRLKAVFGLPD